MDIEKVRDLLSARYKEQHTVHGFLKKDTALGIELEEPMSVYLFPGTLQLDDSVVCFTPKMEAFHCFILSDLNVTKPVKVHTDKQREAESHCEKAVALATLFDAYLSSIPNKYLQSALSNLLVTITSRKTLTAEHYNASMFLLRRLRGIAPSPLLEQLENLVAGYYRLCELNDARKARKTLAQKYAKQFVKIGSIEGETMETVEKKFFSLLKQEQVSIKDVLLLGKAKIVIQVMFLIEVLKEKHFILLEEVLKGFEIFRPDLTTHLNDELLKKSIKKGLDKLLEDHFVEKHEVLEAFSLTTHGRALGLQLVELDLNEDPNLL